MVAHFTLYQVTSTYYFSFAHRFRFLTLTHALLGLIITGCISRATRAAHSSSSSSSSSSTATNEFLFSKLACSEIQAAGKFLNETAKQGMAAIESEVDPSKVQAKAFRRGAVWFLLMHPQLQHDLLPG